MSTRSCFGYYTNKEKSSFNGVYHHWDGHPDILGETIHTHLQKMNANEWCEKFIDGNPQGWSSINSSNDPNSPKIFRDDWNSNGEGFNSYDSGEGDMSFTEKDNLTESGIEFLYLIDKENSIMDVMSSYNEDGSKMIGMFGVGNSNSNWKVIASISLNEPYDFSNIKY